MAAGTPPDEAAVVAQHCVEANQAGHDSHGVLRIPQYVSQIEKGSVIPGAARRVCRETHTTAVLDGGGGLGQVVMSAATELAVRKARQAHLGAVAARNQGHTGRLAAYTLEIAKEDMIAIAVGSSGRVPASVVPFGGAAPRLHTNPISIAIPSTLAAPFCIDMATSAIAWGKVRHAANSGVQLPENMLIDSAGRPTTDPNALFDGGAILPFGGREAHKGFALSAAIQLLCSFLGGLDELEPKRNGTADDCCFLIAIDVAAFRHVPAFKRAVAGFVEDLISSPPVPEGSPVSYPGQRAAQHQRERQTAVPVDAATVEAFCQLANRFDLPDEQRLVVP